MHQYQHQQQPQEHNQSGLFVADIPQYLSDEHFHELWADVPGLVDARLRRDKKDRVVGFVDFIDAAHAARAKDKFQGFQFDANHNGISIHFTRSKSPTQQQQRAHPGCRFQPQQDDFYDTQQPHSQDFLVNNQEQHYLQQQQQHNGYMDQNTFQYQQQRSTPHMRTQSDDSCATEYNNSNLVTFPRFLMGGDNCSAGGGEQAYNIARNRLIDHRRNSVSSQQTTGSCGTGYVARPSIDENDAHGWNFNHNHQQQAQPVLDGGFNSVINVTPDSPTFSSFSSTNTLYVEGLPTDATVREISHLFRTIKGFVSLRLCDKSSPKGKYLLCFVEFDCKESAAHCRTLRQNYVFDPKNDNRGLVIRYARQRLRETLPSVPHNGTLSGTYGLSVSHNGFDPLNSPYGDSNGSYGVPAAPLSAPLSGMISPGVSLSCSRAVVDGIRKLGCQVQQQQQQYHEEQQYQEEQQKNFANQLTNDDDGGATPVPSLYFNRQFSGSSDPSTSGSSALTPNTMSFEENQKQHQYGWEDQDKSQSSSSTPQSGQSASSPAVSPLTSALDVSALSVALSSSSSSPFGSVVFSSGRHFGSMIETNNGAPQDNHLQPGSPLTAVKQYLPRAQQQPQEQAHNIGL